jgi:hypothetical protein
MHTPKEILARGSVALALLIAPAGCAPGNSPSSAARPWQLDGEMRGNTKLCELTWRNPSRSLVIGHQRIPNAPELGYVYLLFRAPELEAAATKRWAVTLQYDTASRTGFLSAVDENDVRIDPNTMLLKDIFAPMETATILDVKVLDSGAVVHFDLTGLSEALPALRACAAEGIAL